MIPIATLRLDNALLLPAVAHCETHGPQTALQSGIANRQSLPYLLAQFLFGDYAITMLNEIAEHLEDFGSESRTLAGPSQGIELCVQDTICEAVDHAPSAER
jgi:hypothetical protein